MILVCASCGKAMFPPRLLCPACGGRDFREEPAESGILEDVADRGEVKLGQVRTHGVVLIARVEIDEPKRGSEIRLDWDGDIPVARA